MVLAIDVYYVKNCAKVVGVWFDWQDSSPIKSNCIQVNNVEDYVSGQFYKRELPCIIQFLSTINLEELDAILVDGHVFVDNNMSLGLGGHLYEYLKKKVPVIGVAKKAFHKTEKVCFPVLRGKSRNPLYVSGIGLDVKVAIQNLIDMHGSYRFPTMLKHLDQLTKS